MKLSDSDYENLYEASLLEYKKAIAAVVHDETKTNATKSTRGASSQSTTAVDDDDKATSAQQQEQLSLSSMTRLMLARVQRMEILTQCAHDSPSPCYAHELRNRVERQMNEDAGKYYSQVVLEDSFPKLPHEDPQRLCRSSHDVPTVDVDVDAFFEAYPHAMRREELVESDNDDESGEDDDDEEEEVQCLGVKRRALATRQEKSSMANESQKQEAPLPSHSSTMQRPGTASSLPPSSGQFEYTPPDTPAPALPLNPQSSFLPPTVQPPSTLLPPQATSYPPPPMANVLPQPPPPPSMAPPPPPHPPSSFNTSTANRQSSWDDHQSHNPFQTAREFAQAAGNEPNEPAPKPHPPPSMAPPPPPHAYPAGYNPYLKPPPQPQQPAINNPYNNQNVPPPEPPAIRDSLRRKFQPPKRGSNPAPNQPRGTASSSGLVKKALGSHRTGSSTSGIAATQRNHDSSTAATHDADENDNDDELPEELQRYGKELVDKIVGEIMDYGDPVTFADIAGLEDVKQTVQEVVCWPMKRPDLFTGLRRAPNGLLLYGPPGTGKTLIGKAIAHESGATFFSISSSSLTSKWIGEGEKLVRTLFAVAAYREPSVVFIDEIDSLLTQRKADENEASRRIKTEFLVQLDGTCTSGQGRVLVIGATNRPQELDDAARRRFVKRLYIPLPEEKDRESLLRVLLEKNHHQLTDDDIKKLAKDTVGFSGADLKSLSAEAAMGPIRQLGSKALEVDANDVPPIGYKHFRMALRGTKPSVSPSDLEQYEVFDKTYGSRRADEEEPFEEDEES